MTLDVTWNPAGIIKREPCPWRPDHAARCWVRPLGDGVVRFAFEIGLSPHDCEAILSIAREGCADVRLEDWGPYWNLVIRAGSAIDEWLTGRRASGVRGRA